VQDVKHILNPKGIVSSSPEVASSELPWVNVPKEILNPNGVVASLQSLPLFACLRIAPLNSKLIDQAASSCNSTDGTS